MVLGYPTKMAQTSISFSILLLKSNGLRPISCASVRKEMGLTTKLLLIVEVLDTFCNYICLHRRYAKNVS